ncbi:hypothetical protein [Roseitranquillus sediminis]|uniref:hypothetical protein n=1 Tax=Roseitranquillus sediminis TaxID=2809051 RepID=UPI001D0C89D9|nr:hypothetical protein [Roseitranquillus sediminis]MBM9594987.1 hypothetical protein [Roseitranquillus sediminis]
MSARTDLAIVPGFRSGRPSYRWRGIGRIEDLEIDFSSRDRPALVTAVLATCAEPPVEDPEEVWRLTLAARVGGLLAIYAETVRTESLPLEVRCPHDDCREGMEVELPVPELVALAQAAEARPETDVAGQDGPIVLRRPRGTDQRLWRRRAYADGAEAEAALLASLVISGTLAAEERSAAAEALAAFDPLSCFEIDVRCPECARQSGIPVDLEAVLLASLSRAQARMISDVDRLARRYGWSEAEVLAIPAWRRRRYLALDGDGWPA